MATVERSVALSVNVSVEVADPSDYEAVEIALKQAGAVALREEFNIDIHPKNIIILDDGPFDDESQSGD